MGFSTFQYWFSLTKGLWTNWSVKDGYKSPSLFSDEIIGGEHFKLHCSLRTDAKKMFNSCNTKKIIELYRDQELTDILSIMDKTDGPEDIQSTDILKELINVYTDIKGADDVCRIFSSACFYKLFNVTIWMREKYSEYININDGFEAACESGDERMINTLLIMEASDYEAGLKGGSRGGKLKVVERMVGFGARNFNSALEVAAAGGHNDVVKYLIQKGQKTVDRNCVLRGGCNSGNIDLVKDALYNGANDYHGGYWKAMQGSIQTVSSPFSFEYGARRTVASKSHLDVVVYILQIMDRL